MISFGLVQVALIGTVFGLEIARVETRKRGKNFFETPSVHPTVPYRSDYSYEYE